MSKKSTEEKGKKAVKVAKKVQPANEIPVLEVKSPDVAAAEPKKKKKVSPPKKDASKKAPAKKSATKSSSRKKSIRPTNEDIALRAYFIAERRQALGWPGDSTGDWVEAERQLLEEAGLKKITERPAPLCG